MDMFSVSREAAQYSSMDRKTSSVQDAAARKQSTFDRRPSGDRRQSYAPNFFRDELPAVRHFFDTNYRVAQKIGTVFVRLNFTKY